MVFVSVLEALKSGAAFMVLSLAAGIGARVLLTGYFLTDRQVKTFAKAAACVVQTGLSLYVAISYSFLGASAYTLFFPAAALITAGGEMGVTEIYRARTSSGIPFIAGVKYVVLANLAGFVITCAAAILLLPTFVN